MVPWAVGDRIVRSEVWGGRRLSAMAVTVVEDSSDLLVVHLAEGTPFAFPEGDWPSPHPWSGHRAWSGHGVLMLHRPDDAYAVWVFWAGEGRSFDRWYVNFQRPLRRTEDGIETLDHEVDLWSKDGREWRWKDEELLRERVDQGWFTASEAKAITENARDVHDDLRQSGPWWDLGWAEWTPPGRR
jgi:hypothetical protein